MGPNTSSDKNDLTTTTLPGGPISPQASDTNTVTTMPTGADMPSMTPSAPTMAADPMNADTSGIDIIPNAGSDVALEASSGLPAGITTPGFTSSEISDTVPNIDTPTGADMPSMTPSAPTMAADPIAANEPDPSQTNPSAPAPPASVAPSSTVLAPTPVKKKNNIVIIGTAILLIAMLIVLVVVYQRTKS